MISVIMPAYNVDNYIEKSVKSVLQQSNDEIELIIIDDGSSDRTLEIARELEKKDSRIVVLENSHAGVSKARYSGLKKASGEWIFFMDSDDLLAPWAFESMLEAVHTSDICKIAALEFQDEKEIVFEMSKDKELKKVIRNGHDACLKLCTEREFTGATLLWGRLIKKELFLHGDIQELFSKQVMKEYPYNFFEDVIIGSRLLAVAQTVTEISNVGYFHRINTSGLSHGMNITDYKYEQIKATMYGLNYYKQRGWIDLYEAQLVDGYFLVMSLYCKANISETDQTKLSACIQDVKSFDKEFEKSLNRIFWHDPIRIIYICFWRYLPKIWLLFMKLYFR